MSFIEKAIPLGLSDQDIYVCPPTQSGSVHGLVLSNTSDATATFKIKLFSQASGLITPITSDVASLAAGAMFVWPKPINMVAGDRIIASASAANAIVALASVYIATANPVSSGFNPRGSWSSSATYNVNDVVSYGGDSYIAVAQSINSVPPSANWMISARKGDIGIVARGTWSNATTYNPNEVVMSSVDHNLYIATQITLGNEPSANPIYWQLLLQNDSVGAAAISATNAAASASSAATSATTATTQAANASSSATAASTSATSANSSAAAAAESQASATSSATSATASASTAATNAATATTQAGNAAASAASAATSATSATASQNKATQWADADLNVQVESGKYSAKHWAMTAQATVTGSLVYRGSWDASSGAYPSTPALGDYYKISVAGTMGGIQFSIGDSMIFNGASWDKIDSSDQVTSVAGRQGAVVLTKSDVGLSNVDDVSDINKPISTAQQTALNAKQDTSGKDASDGYAGLTLFKLNLRNAANTVTSWFANSNTAARTYTLPDKDGTVAMTSDLTSASISNTPSGNVAATTVQNAINELDAEKQAVSNKDASGGYPGLTAFKLNLKNAANTVTNYLTNATTATRTWTMPDKDGAVALLSDITGINSGTNTGDQTTISGNAGTATKLQTARNIDGQSFDGSADIVVIAPGTHAATSKTTPVDADEIPLADSDASFGLKKLTWANLKAAVGGATSLDYSSRGNLRNGTPAANALAIVDGLGLFVFTAGSSEPDDDETCFVATGGAWLLEAAAWDISYAYWLEDVSAIQEDIEDLQAVVRLKLGKDRILTGTATCAITTLASITQSTFTTTINGAATGDRVIVTPPAILSACLSVFAWVSAANTISITINNPSTNTSTGTCAGTWGVAVIKDIA